MTKVKRFPPGKAIGADDLQVWARRRNGGLSGVPHDRQQKNRLHMPKRRRARWLRLLRELAGDQWLFRLIAAVSKLDPQNMQLAVHLLETLVRHLQEHKAARIESAPGPSILSPGTFDFRRIVWERERQ